jgi:hypothetical protein
MASPTTDYDSPWKDAIEQYFAPFLVLCAPRLHAAIDWRCEPQFLDKELQALAHDTDAGRRYADKLVRVRGIDGQPALILVHVEVQGGGTGSVARAHFSKRMFQYAYRIHDRYLINDDMLPDGPSASPEKQGHATTPPTDGPTPCSALFSLGILTQSTGGPAFLSYRRDYLGGGIHFRFPVVHLAKWNRQWPKLERSAATNPFAVVVMAQLKAQASRDGKTRLASKTAITRLLYQHKYSRKDIQQLFRLIDWMITLPQELEPAYQHELDLIEQERKVAYVTSIERLGHQKGLREGIQAGRQEGMQAGRQEGLQEGIEAGQLQGSAAVLRTLMQSKFGQLPPWANDRIAAADASTLQHWALNILNADTIDDVFD